MSDTGTDIIIKGGSVEVNFDGSLYVKDPIDPGKYKNPSRKITRILVEDEDGRPVYDSEINKDGLSWKVTVSTVA